jgi:hypothetical protein
VDLSRRGFLCALSAAPLSRALGAPVRGAHPFRAACALPESRAGFAKALAGRETPGLLVFAGAAGWDHAIAGHVRRGRLVIFESAAAFAEARALDEQRAGLRDAFGLTIDDPVPLWRGERPPYVDLQWPAAARLRDFSYAVPVHGGQSIGSVGALPVAARQRAGAGALLFLGSPVGPALGSGDPEALAWLSSLLDQPPTRAASNRSAAGAMDRATPATHSATTMAVNTSIV